MFPVAAFVTAVIVGPEGAGLASCVIVTGTPAMETVARRGPARLLATASVMVAGPEPTALPGTVIHPGSPEIAHEQDGLVWTPTVMVPLAAATIELRGLTV